MHTSSEIVFGYHGCDQSVADNVIKKSQSLGISENVYDWLGHGIYFWEGSYDRALNWAKNHPKVKDPAVIGVVIKLGNCLDLLDTEHTEKLKITYEMLVQELENFNKPIPINKISKSGFSYFRELDCRVIMRLHQLNNELIAEELGLENITGSNLVKIQKHHQFIDSVRGMFPEGDELYPNAGFRLKNHIQLCIVNPNCIIGYFEPREIDINYKKI